MPIITATIQMGAYISIFKLVVFVIGFFALLPLITWVNNDAQKVRTKAQNWTAIVLLTGAIGAFVWLLIPLFIIGLLIYIIAVSAAAVIYVMHRNSLVDEFQKILPVQT